MAGSDGSAVTDFPGLVSLLAVGPGRTQLATRHTKACTAHGTGGGPLSASSTPDRCIRETNHFNLASLVILWLLVLHRRLVSVGGWNEKLNISNSLKSRPSSE